MGNKKEELSQENVMNLYFEIRSQESHNVKTRQYDDKTMIKCIASKILKVVDKEAGENEI
jgi:hypothetical protein